MWLPNLEFRNTRYESESQTLQTFLLRNLPLYRASIIERFSLCLSYLDIDLEEVKSWIQFAVSRNVHKLHIFHYSEYGDDILPCSLFTSKSLVTLELYLGIFIDVPRVVCLPYLKTLRLEDVNFDNYDSLPLLLSNCPVLEDLSLSDLHFGGVGKLIVRVSSLQRLSLQVTEYVDEFVMDTPSLNYLKLESAYAHLHILTNMPKLEEACVDVSFSLFTKLIRSIPSVKRLTLCLSFKNISEVGFDDRFVFNKLKHLKLCICRHDSSNVLVKLIKVSPNLRELELFKMDVHGGYMEYWNQPSSVPECISSSLETFKWSRYHGTKEERELVIYVLQNAHRLKTATINFYKYSLLRTFDIKKELELSHRASTTCQLLFH